MRKIFGFALSLVVTCHCVNGLQFNFLDHLMSKDLLKLAKEKCIFQWCLKASVLTTYIMIHNYISTVFTLSFLEPFACPSG